MTRKQKTVMLVVVATYPAFSALDAMLWTLTGLSFFWSPDVDSRAYRDHGMLRTMMTIGLTFATAALANLIDVDEDDSKNR